MTSSIRTKPMDPSTIKEINSKALLEATMFVDKLLAGKTRWPRYPVLSDWMRNISAKREIWTKTSQSIRLNHTKCVDCSRCVNRCPVNALTMKNKTIKIDHSKCISCVRCVHHCPKDAFTWKGQQVIRVPTKNFKTIYLELNRIQT